MTERELYHELATVWMKIFNCTYLATSLRLPDISQFPDHVQKAFQSFAYEMSVHYCNKRNELDQQQTNEKNNNA